MANMGQSSLFFDLVKAIPYGDKIGHVLLFGFLTLGINISTRFKCAELGHVRIYMGTALVSLFVLAEELSQSFVISRTFDVMDLIADAIGILIFTLISMRLSLKHLIRS
ncbi:MAG: VanZ family protein [Thermodesulfobacteriota bacterium]